MSGMNPAACRQNARLRQRPPVTRSCPARSCQEATSINPAALSSSRTAGACCQPCSINSQPPGRRWVGRRRSVGGCSSGRRQSRSARRPVQSAGRLVAGGVVGGDIGRLDAKRSNCSPATAAYQSDSRQVTARFSRWPLACARCASASGEASSARCRRRGGCAPAPAPLRRCRCQVQRAAVGRQPRQPAVSTRISVSGRGISTAGDTARSRPKTRAHPTDGQSARPRGGGRTARQSAGPPRRWLRVRARSVG